MDQKSLERMAMESLLPGLKCAVDNAIALLNEVRRPLALPPVRLVEGEEVRRGRPPARRVSAPPPGAPIRETGGLYTVDAVETGPAPKKQKPKRRKLTAAAKKNVAQAVRERWAVVKEAGIKPKNGSPSNEEVARALKMLEKKGKSAAA